MGHGYLIQFADNIETWNQEFAMHVTEEKKIQWYEKPELVCYLIII